MEDEVPVIQSSVLEKKAVKHLPFDKYYEQWLNLATSVKPNQEENISLSRKEQKEILQNHKYLLYGKFNNYKRSGDLGQKKKIRVEQFKKLYQKPALTEATSWELEAQELLEWTKSLATD